MTLDKEKVDEIISVLNDPEITALFDKAGQDMIDRNTLMDIPLPSGISMRQTEQLINSVCKLLSIKYPLIGSDNIEYWFYITRDMLSLLWTIDHKCSPTSKISQSLSSEHGQRLSSISYRAAAYESFQQIHGEIDSVKMKRLALLEDKPTSPEECLLLNMITLYDNMNAFANIPLTASFLDNIYEQLTDGIPGCMKLNELPSFLDGQPRQARLNLIIDSSLQCWSGINPLLDIIPLRWSLQHTQPYGKYSIFISDFFYRQHCIRSGYSILSRIPFSITWRPEYHAIVNTNDKEPIPAIQPNGNMTSLITESLRNIVEQIEKQEEICMSVLEKDDKMIELLHDDTNLNHRQRSILSRSLRRPDSKFYIGYHRKTHKIAYSTARADFFDLVEKKLMLKKTEGKAFCFVAVPNLEEAISEYVNNA